MKRLLLASAAALALALPQPKANAALPVIDIDNIVQSFKQLQEMIAVKDQVTRQLQTLQNVPRQLIGQFQGLMDLGVSNPLQDITANLESLMHGSGTGRCAGGDGLMALNQYAEALPMAGASNIDFTGAQINGSAARSAGLLACTQQMMAGTQSRLRQMPDLLRGLESCGDITCLEGMSGRIQYEQAIVAAQTQQATLVHMNAQQQRWNMEDQAMQKMRADADQGVNATGGANALSTGGGGTGPAAPSMAMPTFNATLMR